MDRTGPSVLLCAVLCLAVSASPLHAEPTAADLIAHVRPLYTTFGDPADNVVSPGQGFDGVADLIIQTTQGTFRCTGSLLTTGRDILTAAHCLTNSAGTLITSSVTATFELPGGDVIRNSSDVVVHDNWNGEFTTGNDIAIITLASLVPAEVQRYDIYRNSDEVGQIGVKAGYGRSGNGDDGDVLSSGTKHSGMNLYDALGDVFDPVGGIDPIPGSQLAYDFDNGLSANDAFGFFDSTLGAGDLSDLGVGADEVISAPGDSGSPTFINDLIAGVTSWGLRLQFQAGPPPKTSDVDRQLNSTFGEFGVDTRVSFHAVWIDSNISLLGDFNDDGLVDADDIDLLFAEVAAGTHDPFFELTGDAFVDQADVDELVLNILGSLFGDANLDLAVSFADFTALQNNFGLAGGWANANFNGDALITFSDFSILQNNFGQSGTGAPTSVPEPATIMLVALGSVGLLARRRRSSPLS